MGVCMSEDRSFKEEISKMDKLQISDTLKSTYLITSKQLNPADDPSMQLLGRYFDMYKSEMSAFMFKFYLDVLGVDTEKLINVKFSGLKIEDRQTKFLCIGLSYCLQLESLDLSDCGITDKGITYVVKGLAHNAGLIRLDLSKNAFGTVGLRYLVRGLHYTQVLEYLDLSYLEIKEEDVKVIGEILETCPFLSCLRLEHVTANKFAVDYLALLSRSYKCKNFLLSVEEGLETD